MPLSEFYKMARGNPESSHQKPTSFTSDLTHLPDKNEFAELVWENGQVMIQGQSTRPSKNISINSNDFQSYFSKYQDQDLVVNNTCIPKTTKYGIIGSVLDDFTATVPSSNLDLDQDDDMAPWLNYNNYNPLHNDLCSDFIPELSSITVNNIIPSVAKENVSGTISNSLGQASLGGFSNTSSGFINFSHFSRPVAHACDTTSSSSGVDKTGFADKAKFLPIGNEAGSGTSQPKLLTKVVNVENPEKVEGVVTIKVSGEGTKAVEPVVDSSSLCSGNNPEQGSDDHNRNLKRKSRETDDSEGRSEDLEEESVGIKKSGPVRGGTGTKRGRAAEVHNLSERRRRDRINEKMRALQELIPNCNKVDKASMLDEAIEYLKTLQLQVQMMSMGAGMYMPQMMTHFSPMMGVGMGFGIGMNGGVHFHDPRAHPFSGPASFQRMTRPNLPVFRPNGPMPDHVSSKEVNEVLPS